MFPVKSSYRYLPLSFHLNYLTTADVGGRSGNDKFNRHNIDSGNSSRYFSSSDQTYQDQAVHHNDPA